MSTQFTPDVSIEPKLLDEITGPEALTWATTWSDATEKAVRTQPGTAELEQRMRAALDTEDKIPYVSRRGKHLYNFWRDRDHPRGVWRRTTTEEYLAGGEQWEVLVDVDKLAADEAEDWVFKGAAVRPHAHDRALVRLSRGGADAVVVREFDLATREFGGFELPEAKSEVS